MKILLLSIFIFTSISLAQTKMESNLDAAYQNAKKGVYWALTNIPEKKIRLASDLVADEKLYASVKLIKEYEGIKIISKGVFNSTEVLITVYRSNDGLLKDGYLKQTKEEEPEVVN